MEKFDYHFRVHAGDTDYGGVMYHPNYIDFFERARVEWFNSLGVNLADWARKRIFFPVATLTIDYLQPTFFNDPLLIKSEMTKVGRVSIIFEQEMFKGIDLVSRLVVKVGCVDDLKKPMAIPSEIQDALQLDLNR